MNKETEHHKRIGRVENRAGSKRKRPYRSPKQTKFGDLRSLVLGSSGGGPDTFSKKTGV